MKEIDDSGSEFFPLREPIQGGKEHGGLGTPLLAKAMLSVAAAGLLTVSVLTAVPNEGVPAMYGDQPPAVEVPSEPLPPPEEPEVKPPVKKPEIPPPPTTPPPTTLPPTTPPPTTPPYIPPEEPVEEFTAPSLSRISGYAVMDGELFVRANYYVDMGSADKVFIYPACTVPGWGAYSDFTPRAVLESGYIEEDEFPCEQRDLINTPAPSGDTVEVYLTLKYEQDGATNTIPYSATFPIL
jgi:hypothetical protein